MQLRRETIFRSPEVTRNVPCKGDGSDPSELQVKISAQEIHSKVGVCTFLRTKHDGKSVDAQLDASLPPDPCWATSLSRCRPTVRSNSLIATRTIARSFIAVRSNRPDGALHALAPSLSFGMQNLNAD